MPVPNIFASATAAIPLSQLDQNFATAITLGNTAVYLGNTTTSLGNVTLTNVTISSGNVTVSAGSNTSPSITTVGDTNTGIFFPAADTIAFTEGGVESMRIDASGNMGLGVTPSASSSLIKAFDFNTTGGIGSYSNSTSTQFTYVSSNAFLNSSVNWTYKFTGYAASAYMQNNGTGVHQWLVAPSGTAGNTISFTQAMTLDASGNLLLGQSSGSGYRLNVKAAFSSGLAGAYIEAGEFDKSIMVLNHTNGSVATNLFQVQKSGTGVMTLDASGNLLVGTTTSTGRVAVQVAANGDPGVYFRNASGTNVGQIQVQSASTVYVTSSDYRLKENVTPMTGALAAVAALKPCTYTWKESGEASQGFIAHELAEVCPDAVIGEKDGEEMQGVDYGKLTPILTAALQEAIAKIETLEARIAVLEAK